MNLLDKKTMKGVDLSIQESIYNLFNERYSLTKLPIDLKDHSMVKKCKEASFWIHLNGINKKLTDEKYTWGILEIVHIAKQLNTGVILLAKTNNDPNENQLKIINNIDILIHHPEQYIIIVYRKKTKSFHVVMNMSSQTVIHRIEGLSDKMNMYIQKRNTPPKTNVKKFLNQFYKEI